MPVHYSELAGSGVWPSGARPTGGLGGCDGFWRGGG